MRVQGGMLSQHVLPSMRTARGDGGGRRSGGGNGDDGNGNGANNGTGNGDGYYNNGNGCRGSFHELRYDWDNEWNLAHVV